MNIPIKTGVEANCPSIPVETGDLNIPRKPILFEGGDIPAVVNPLSVTENGTYTAPEGVDGYNPVTVNVPSAIIESLSVTENGTYTAPAGKAYSPVTVNVPVPPVPGTVINDADMVTRIPVPVEPDVLPEGMLYMIPRGHQYCPPIPEVTGSPWAVICCDAVVTQPYSWVNHDRLVASTKFWLFMDPGQAKCRRDAIQTLSWGDSTGNTPPLHAYVYDTSSPNFEWVELDTTDAQFIADFNKQATDSGAIIHNTLEVCFTNYNLFRYTVGSLEYDMSLSTLNQYSREINPYYIDEFECYLVDDTHTAVYQDTYTLKELITAYR